MNPDTLFHYGDGWMTGAAWDLVKVMAVFGGLDLEEFTRRLLATL